MNNGTSLLKLFFVNSSEFSMALVAAWRTCTDGWSLRMPCTMAVRIWFAFDSMTSGGKSWQM